MNMTMNRKVEKALREFEMGTLRDADGKKVTNRSQAIAIGLYEARKVARKNMRDQMSPDAPLASKDGPDLVSRYSGYSGPVLAKLGPLAAQGRAIGGVTGSGRKRDGG